MEGTTRTMLKSYLGIILTEFNWICSRKVKISLGYFETSWRVVCSHLSFLMFSYVIVIDNLIQKIHNSIANTLELPSNI